MSTKHEQKFKPCPFCGYRADLRWNAGRYYIECAGPDCPVWPMTDSFEAEADAVKAWETRL